MDTIQETYKETKIGKIPNEWEVVKMKEVASFSQGTQIPNSNLFTENVENKLYRYLYISDFFTDRKIFYTTEKRTNYLVLESDLVIVNTGNTTGKLLTGKTGILCNNAFKITINNESLSQLYTKQYLDSHFYKKQIANILNSGGQPHLGHKNMGMVWIPKPPLSEQKKIAEILSTVDEQISLTEKIIEKSKELKKGLMQKLFSEGIGHTEFKKTKIGRIPKDWEVLKVDDLLKRGVISSIQDGNHGGIHPKSSDFVTEGIPFIMANSITKNNKLKLEGVSRISVEQYQTLRIGFAEPKDILLTHKGTVGLTAIVNDFHGSLMLTPQVTYYRIPNDDVLERKFLYYYFQSNIFQEIIDRYSTQSTRAYIGITNQKKLPLMLPNSISEQKKIVDILSEADAKIEKEEIKKKKLEELKKGLIQQLLTGKKRVKI